MEEARRDAGLKTDVDVIQEVNEAVGAGDIPAISERVHPDVVWEHNLGSGSPEEGVYRGRDSVARLFERIVETWEYLRPEPREIDDLGSGAYRVRGELHAKHPTSATELVAPYVQRLELRDRLLIKAQMATGSDQIRQFDKTAVIERFADAFNRLDLDTVVGDLDPEIELHEWPTAGGGGTYRGHDGVRKALDFWFESWEWMRVEVEDVVEVGDLALVTLHQRAKGRGSSIEVELRSFNVYTFRDGKVTRIQLFTEREHALEAAGMSESYEEQTR